VVSVAIESLSVDLGRRSVLRDVSATLAAGELIGIVGPNGAGKSTLVRAMLGLVSPRGGSIRVDGADIASLSGRALARALSYLPQGQTLHWPLSVERLVALGRLPHLGPLSRLTDTDQRAIAEAMARADVVDLSGRVATELSGGERARVMLARALAVGAPGLIVDEPLTSLDPGHQIDVMELLAREAADGALVVAVLHDLTMAARYCRRLLLIGDGTLIADGPPAEVLTAQRLRAVYGITALVGMQGDAPLVVPLGRVEGGVP
jgi:iron complex transport system ATP-binding protein